MRIYCCYSESHRELYDRFFLPSIPDSCQQTTILIEQKCESGVYHSKNWAAGMVQKVRVIIRAIETELEQEKDRIFLFSDVDVVFLAEVAADLTNRMAGFDILAANDDDLHCTGFMAIRANERTLQTFKWVEQRVVRAKCDQIAFAQFVRFQERPTWFDYLQRSWRRYRKNPLADPEPVRIGILPSDQYGNFSHLQQKTHFWNGSDKLEVAPERLAKLRVFHGNFTEGIERKVALLQLVQDLVQQVALPELS